MAMITDVYNPSSKHVRFATVRFPYSILYYKTHGYESYTYGSDGTDKRTLELGVTTNDGANYLQALYYISGSTSA